jgi:hypothetical protein
MAKVIMVRMSPQRARKGVGRIWVEPGDINELIVAPVDRLQKCDIHCLGAGLLNIQPGGLEGFSLRAKIAEEGS